MNLPAISTRPQLIRSDPHAPTGFQPAPYANPNHHHYPQYPAPPVKYWSAHPHYTGPSAYSANNVQYQQQQQQQQVTVVAAANPPPTIVQQAPLANFIHAVVIASIAISINPVFGTIALILASKLHYFDQYILSVNICYCVDRIRMTMVTAVQLFNV